MLLCIQPCLTISQRALKEPFCKTVQSFVCLTVCLSVQLSIHPSTIYYQVSVDLLHGGHLDVTHLYLQPKVIRLRQIQTTVSWDMSLWGYKSLVDAPSIKIDASAMVLPVSTLWSIDAKWLQIKQHALVAYYVSFAPKSMWSRAAYPT